MGGHTKDPRTYASQSRMTSYRAFLASVARRPEQRSRVESESVFPPPERLASLLLAALCAAAAIEPLRRP